MLHATASTNLPNIHATLSKMEMAFAGYLARFHGNTLKNYEFHLRCYFRWCLEHDLDPLEAKRPHLEFYVRDLIEERKLKASTVSSAMTPVKGFYDFAVWDEYIDRDPARKVALPKYRYEKSKPVHQRDLLIFLDTAKHDCSPRHWALVALLSQMGLRISEATGLRIENYTGLETGMPTLRYVQKGGATVETPLPLPTLYAIEPVIAGRAEGPVIPQRDGVSPLGRGGGAGLIRTVNRRAALHGCRRYINPHLLRKMAITEALESGMNPRRVKDFARHVDDRTLYRHYDLGRDNHYRHPVHEVASRMAV